MHLTGKWYRNNVNYRIKIKLITDGDLFYSKTFTSWLEIDTEECWSFVRLRQETILYVLSSRIKSDSLSRFSILYCLITLCYAVIVSDYGKKTFKVLSLVV